MLSPCSTLALTGKLPWPPAGAERGKRWTSSSALAAPDTSADAPQGRHLNGGNKCRQLDSSMLSSQGTALDFATPGDAVPCHRYDRQSRSHQALGAIVGTLRGPSQPLHSDAPQGRRSCALGLVLRCCLSASPRGVAVRTLHQSAVGSRTTRPRRRLPTSPPPCPALPAYAGRFLRCAAVTRRTLLFAGRSVKLPRSEHG